MPRPAFHAQPGRFASWKQRMWHELHSRAALLTSGKHSFNAAIERDWLEKYDRRIPCKGCRSHWKRLMAKHPPELDSAAHYFRWTVRMHNALNQWLGKPMMAYAAACRRHGINREN